MYNSTIFLHTSTAFLLHYIVSSVPSQVKYVDIIQAFKTNKNFAVGLDDNINIQRHFYLINIFFAVRAVN